MESESDYGDEIQSPDEDEGEMKTNDDGDERMEVDEDDDEEHGDSGNNHGAKRGNSDQESGNLDEESSRNNGEESRNNNDEIMTGGTDTEDNSLDASSKVRSPSIAHSNISEEEDADADADDAVPEPEDAAKAVPETATVRRPNGEDGRVDQDSEDDSENKNNDDEDKSSSYRSSPPESPSPPRSPDDAYDKGGAGAGSGNDQNHRAEERGQRSPKQSLEDQDGELDFEEELPERKEDCDSVGERPKTSDKSDEVSNKGGDNEEEEEDGEEGEEKDETTVDKKKQNDKKADDGDDDDDDGEVEDDDDLEEGEVKDGSAVRKVLQRPMCRFFAKGQCTWGNNCRFLHPGINDKGNYNMFAPPKPLVPSNGPGFGWHGGGSRISPPFHARGFAEPVLPPPPPAFDEPAYESAWERGLRHAKEILKKSNKRKEMEPDFEEKRMNLSLGGGEGSNEYEKENDYYSRSPYRAGTDPFDPYGYDEPALDPYERQAHDYWRGGNYENFEVRYTRTDYDYRDHDRLRERERIDRARERDREREQIFRERERERDPRSRRDKFERPPHSPERNWRDERYVDPQIPPRARGDEWRDPWRRSTSPKRRNLSRSFSSHSSASYSSSRSSGSGSSSYSSRSRSSSGSSHSSYSSRSYTHSRSSRSKTTKNKSFAPSSAPGQGSAGSNLGGAQARKAKPQAPSQQQQQSDHLPASGNKVPRPAPQEKRTAPAPSQPPPVAAPQVVPPPVAERKKAAEKPGQPKVPAGRMRSLSTSGSESASSRSRSRSSRSGSSGSRSSSISSLESVSSKSSISSKSSADSDLEVVPPREIPPKKADDKPKKEKQKMKAAVDPNWKSSFERIRPSKADPQAATEAHIKALVNSPRASKDPLKQSGQKTQIKLTLLNKDKVLTTQSALTARKDDARKPKQPQIAAVAGGQEKAEASKSTKAGPTPSASIAGKKRPLQPSPKSEGQADSASGTQKTSASSSSSASRSGGSAASAQSSSNKPSAAAAQSAAAAAAAQLKKSTSSRREELLKQLKAVEDAIARKRAKLA